MVTIKKYNNRKYYNTETSQYTSLIELANMVLSDEVFEVIEVHTKKDITSEVLVDVLSLTLKSSLHEVCAKNLVDMIQTAGSGGLDCDSDCTYTDENEGTIQ